jgi:hypothetical protein
MTEESRKILDELIREHSCRYARPSGLSDEEYERIEKYNRHDDKICEFLKSIPLIESRLCLGGYIQDKNGTPCCDGDMVYFLSKSQNEKYGYLKWDKKLARFLIEVVGESDCGYIIPELKWFEKVELHEVQSYKDIK